MSWVVYLLPLLLLLLGVAAFTQAQQLQDNASRLSLNPLTLTFDHCRAPQFLDRSSYTCACPEPLVKYHDQCVCDNCIHSEKDGEYEKTNLEQLPEYLSEFLKTVDDSENANDTPEDDEVASRIYLPPELNQQGDRKRRPKGLKKKHKLRRLGDMLKKIRRKQNIALMHLLQLRLQLRYQALKKITALREKIKKNQESDWLYQSRRTDIPKKKNFMQGLNKSDLKVLKIQPKPSFVPITPPPLLHTSHPVLPTSQQFYPDAPAYAPLLMLKKPIRVEVLQDGQEVNQSEAPPTPQDHDQVEIVSKESSTLSAVTKDKELVTLSPNVASNTTVSTSPSLQLNASTQTNLIEDIPFQPLNLDEPTETDQIEEIPVPTSLLSGFNTSTEKSEVEEMLLSTSPPPDVNTFTEIYQVGEISVSESLLNTSSETNFTEEMLVPLSLVPELNTSTETNQKEKIPDPMSPPPDVNTSTEVNLIEETPASASLPSELDTSTEVNLIEETPASASLPSELDTSTEVKLIEETPASASLPSELDTSTEANLIEETPASASLPSELDTSTEVNLIEETPASASLPSELDTSTEANLIEETPASASLPPELDTSTEANLIKETPASASLPSELDTSTEANLIEKTPASASLPSELDTSTEANLIEETPASASLPSELDTSTETNLIEETPASASLPSELDTSTEANLIEETSNSTLFPQTLDSSVSESSSLSTTRPNLDFYYTDEQEQESNTSPGEEGLFLESNEGAISGESIKNAVGTPTFSGSLIAGTTSGAASKDNDTAMGYVSGMRGTGTMSLATGGGSAGGAAFTGEGDSFIQVGSDGAMASGASMIGKKAEMGSAVLSMVVGEGDVIAVNSQGNNSSASAAAVATKESASVGTAAVGGATASAAAAPGKGDASSNAVYGDALQTVSQVKGKDGVMAESASTGDLKHTLEEAIAAAVENDSYDSPKMSKNHILSQSDMGLDFDDIFGEEMPKKRSVYRQLTNIKRLKKGRPWI